MSSGVGFVTLFVVCMCLFRVGGCATPVLGLLGEGAGDLPQALVEADVFS